MRATKPLTKMAFFDFETTGLSPNNDHPTEIAIKVVDLQTAQSKSYSSTIKLPEGVTLSEKIKELTGLTEEYLEEHGTDVKEVAQELYDFLGEDAEEDTMFIAHNANFDLGFMAYNFGIIPKHYVCTRTVALLTAPDQNASLNNVYKRLFGEGNEQTHRAMGDVEMMESVMSYYLQSEGPEAMAFFANRLAIMPERELVYSPPYARLLDFTKKYAVKK